VSLALLIILILGQEFREVDLLKIAGKARSQVESEIGKPTKTEFYNPNGKTQCQCEKVFYLDGNISITYFLGKADWITVLPKVKLLNVELAKIKEYHNWRTHILIKTYTNKDKECCDIQSVI